jgi:hypothetical protein
VSGTTTLSLLPPQQLACHRNSSLLIRKQGRQCQPHAVLCYAVCSCPQVIAQYVLDKYSGQGPAMMAADPESRAIATLAARIHDQYITPIQVQQTMLPAVVGPAWVGWGRGLGRTTHVCSSGQLRF